MPDAFRIKHLASTISGAIPFRGTQRTCERSCE
jgi:hypothetical protein